MHKAIQIFEHDSLRIGERGFTDAHFDALVKFNQRHGNDFFVVGYRSLKFTCYVGVIQVGGLSVEILPKADRAPSPDKTKWRNALIDMLRACGYLELSAVSRAHLRLRHASLFDLYMEAFLAEAETLFHQGLVKKYRHDEGNVLALKGRILFSRHLTENLIHRERFFTCHQIYDRDNLLNRVIRKAVGIVAISARSHTVQRAAGTMLSWLDGITDVPVTAEVFDRIRFDRNTQRYCEAVKLAKLIILNYQPDVRSGNYDVLAILFNMNQLFEEYVLRQLRRAAPRYAEHAIRVAGQRSKYFWRSDTVSKQIRPDILVSYGRGANKKHVVLDTKWKVPKTRHPEDADLKQMFAYNIQFGSDESYLLYPRIQGEQNVGGQFQESRLAPSINHGCGMWFIDLFEGPSLNRKLGDEVLARIVETDSMPAG